MPTAQRPISNRPTMPTRAFAIGSASRPISRASSGAGRASVRSPIA
jgi:hypothetical protein